MEGEWIITAQWDKCYNRGIYKKLEIALWKTSLNKLPSFFLLDYSLMYIAQSGITGSFKRWKQFGTKRCNDLPGEYSSIFNRGNRIVDNSRFRPLCQEDRAVVNYTRRQWLPGGGAPILNMSPRLKTHMTLCTISQINPSHRNLAVSVLLFLFYKGGTCASVKKKWLACFRS